MEELNNKINNMIAEYECNEGCKLKISVYNGDKSYNGLEFEGDKILLERK
jgi:hypothetical protein